MSWINDVNYELKKLDLSKKSLRKFGITLGIVFGLVTIWFWYKNFNLVFTLFFLFTAIIFIVSGYFIPSSLKRINIYWMALAFFLGWFVSRFILTLLFVLILTPIALLGRIFRKKFLDISFKEKKDSYWIKKNDQKINYEKMY